MESAISGGTDARIASADALLSYLAVRINASLTLLTREELLGRLSQTELPLDLARRVEDTLDAGEEARYSPAPASSTSGRDYVERTIQIMNDIEDVLGV